MWDYMGLTRVYTKRRGEAPDFTEPVVLSAERRGVTVESACKTVRLDCVSNEWGLIGLDF